MPYDLDASQQAPPRRPARSLREGAVELMLRAQVGADLAEPALRRELRRLVAATHDPVAALWETYSGGRALRAARH